MLIRPFRAEDTDAVVTLWTACALVRPWNDPRADIARKLNEQPELFLVGEEEVGAHGVGTDEVGTDVIDVDGPGEKHLREAYSRAKISGANGTGANAEHTTGRIIGSAMAGYDGHRGWVHYLAVDPTLHRTGLGRQLMAEVERLLRERGCPKLNLQVRSDNLAVLAFYRGLAYGEEQVVGLGKRLILDES